MNRRDILKGASLAGLATFFSSRGFSFPNLDPSDVEPLVKCAIYPSETAGPFPLDLSGDPSKFRQTINEDRTGVPLKVILSVININDQCNPVPNARVDLWHNDKEGDYSGFSAFGTEGETWCRGIQMTDSIGQVTFNTIYPGWYPGRVTHMHFSVYAGSTMEFTSQLAFPDEINQKIYVENPTIYTKGQNTTVSNNMADSIFASPAGALSLQLCSIVEDSSVSGGYIAGLVVPILGPVASVPEPETGGQFELKQNYPNPFISATTVPFTLKHSGNVSLEIFDMNGKKVESIAPVRLGPGSHTIELDRQGLLAHLGSGSYVYQFTCENSFGRFTQCKVMTRQ